MLGPLDVVFYRPGGAKALLIMLRWALYQYVSGLYHLPTLYCDYLAFQLRKKVTFCLFL